jgi:hypothetical protein
LYIKILSLNLISVKRKQEVATLVYENLSAGSYSYEWNASNLPSGLYLYRLEAEGFVEVKKMILMR